MRDIERNRHAAFTAVIQADRSTISARGELEIFTVDLLRGALAHLALHDPARITIDLSKVTAIDRSSARLLDSWQHTGAPNGAVPVTLLNPKPAVAAILAAEQAPTSAGPAPASVDTPTTADAGRPSSPPTTPRESRTSRTADAHRIRCLTPGPMRHPTSAAP